MKRFAVLVWLVTWGFACVSHAEPRAGRSRRVRAPRETAVRLGRPAPRRPARRAGAAPERSVPPAPDEQLADFEDASGLGAPRRGRQPAATAERDPEFEPGRADDDAQTSSPSWTGPRVELAYVRYTLADARGGGAVEAGQFGGYLNIGPVRIGAAGEFGLRDYALGGDDVLLRGELRAGYQHLTGLEPVVPYVVVVGSYGLLLGKRFHTPISDTVGGIGAEVGLDLNIVRTFFVGVGLGYLRAQMQDLAYDILSLRLRIGL